MVDNNTVPNFIPKKDDIAKAKRHINRIRQYLNIFLYVSIGLFVIAVIAAVLLYLLNDWATSQLTQRQTDLFEARNEYKPAEVAELNRFDTRLRVATNLLRDHRRMHRVFSEIEDNVLSVVQLIDASFAYDESHNLIVTGSGEAADFESLALQSDQFTKSDFISNPIFTSFEENEEGLVSFQYSFVIDARLTQPIDILDQPSVNVVTPDLVPSTPNFNQIDYE